jgi:hypothetical protein
MTEAQAAYLRRLSEDSGVAFEPDLSKAEASRRIDELRSAQGGKAARPAQRRREKPVDRSGRGAPSSDALAQANEPMTEAQSAYLKELAEEEGGEFDPSFTKEEAARRIGELLIRQMSRTSPTEPSRR